MQHDHAQLVVDIDRLSAVTPVPDGSGQRTLSVDHTQHLADRYNLPGKAVEIVALQRGIAPLRYQRNHTTLLPQEQIRLLESRVVVVGLGGLGGTVTEILARVGVGHLVLVDGDVFEDHNLNRQLLCTHATLGRSKAGVAAQRVKAVNSSVRVDTWDTPCTEQNRMELFRQSQVVVECLDSIPARFVVQDGTQQADIPLISAAVAGVSGHVTTIYPQDRGLELIYGPGLNSRQSPKGVETFLGCLPQIVSLIASIESAEAIKVLLNHTEHLLRNRLLVIDLSTNSYDTLRLV